MSQNECLPSAAACPLCGSFTLAAMWVDWNYRVVCLTPLTDLQRQMGLMEGTGCGAYGPPSKTILGALEGWNRRSAPQISANEMEAWVDQLREMGGYAPRLRLVDGKEDGDAQG